MDNQRRFASRYYRIKGNPLIPFGAEVALDHFGCSWGTVKVWYGQGDRMHPHILPAHAIRREPAGLTKQMRELEAKGQKTLKLRRQ